MNMCEPDPNDLLLHMTRREMVGRCAWNSFGKTTHIAGTE